MDPASRENAEAHEELSDRPAKRLKITFKQDKSQDESSVKREESVDEVLPSPNARMSRSGRAIKAPTAYVPSPIPVVVAGKRQRTARKKMANIICAKCDRGTSPQSNPIVFCSGCESTWHQKCHDPEIPDDAILDEDKEWHCYRCVPRQRRSTGTRPTKTHESNTLVQQRNQLEIGSLPINTGERRDYFSRLSHAQLVDILVDISTKIPDLKDLKLPSTSSIQQKSFSPIPASPRQKVEDEEGYRKYPRAGHGFALSREPADLDIIKEAPGSNTFSHALDISKKYAPKRVWTQVTSFGKYFLG